MKIAAALGMCLLLQDGAVQLKWKFAKDQEFRWEWRQRVSMESDMMTIDQDMTYTLRQTVKEVSGDSATLQTVVEALRFKLDGNIQGEYDSTKDKTKPEEAYPAALAGMVGGEFTVVLDGRGAIKSLKGFDAVLKKMLDEAGDEAEMARPMLEPVYSDDAMKGMLQMAFPELPKEPVAAGATWKNEFPISMAGAGTLKFALESALKEVRKGSEGSEAVIEEKFKVTSGGDGTFFQLSDGKGTRKAVFNIDRGVLVESALDSVLTMQFGDQDVPVKSTSKIKPLPARVETKGEKK